MLPKLHPSQFSCALIDDVQINIMKNRYNLLNLTDELIIGEQTAQEIGWR